MNPDHDTYWKGIWREFYKHKIGRYALFVICLFCLVGIFAPFLASSKPIFVLFNGEPYFPLFRYLFYIGYYTKPLDIFFNLMIFIFPLIVISFLILQKKIRSTAVTLLILLQFIIFIVLMIFPLKDPASNGLLNQEREIAIKENKASQPNWSFDLLYMTPYAKLNLVLRYHQREVQNNTLMAYQEAYFAGTNKKKLPTLWQIDLDNEARQIVYYNDIIAKQRAENSPDLTVIQEAEKQLNFILDKQSWLKEQEQQLRFLIMPLFSPFHWEEDAGGQQALNKYVPWWDLTRINRKDLLSGLIFGVRISLIVGITAVGLALLIGIPVGALAGFYGGTLDIIVSRLLEIWEAMPTFFMLLMVVAILQSKSIFLVIAVIGLFGWTGFSRYIRGEFFKQRNLAYVEACQASGFRDGYIIFKHILPNAIPPILTLLPFAIMGAISSEAGLSFLGLGEEGSCSWGVLMDEGRAVFPQESYLMWPPAIALTILLIAIAMVGDSLRDALDPKLRR